MIFQDFLSHFPLIIIYTNAIHLSIMSFDDRVRQMEESNRRLRARLNPNEQKEDLYRRMEEENRRLQAEVERMEENNRQEQSDYFERRCPVVNQLNLDRIMCSVSRFGLGIGFVQSGKTYFINHLMYKIHLLYPTAMVVIMVPNLCAMREQSRNRLVEFDGKDKGIVAYNAEFGTHLPTMAGDDVVFHEASRSNRGQYQYILALENQANLINVIQDVVIRREHDPTAKLFLIVDEVDTVYKDVATKFHGPFQQVREMASMVFGITATPADSFISEQKIESQFVHIIPPQPNYKGWDYLTKIAIQSDRPNRKNNVVIDDTQCIQELAKLNQIPPWVCVDEEKKEYVHPVNVLVKTSERTDHHTQYLDAFRTDPRFERWAILSFNGKGIKLVCRSLDHPDIVINNTRIRSPPSGIFDIDTSVSYPEVISFLVQHHVSHIVTVAGILANRGYSFVSSNYKIHLTHEYLLCSTTSTCTNDNQSLRLLGVYPDNIPLTLLTTQTVLDAIEKSRTVMTKWIESSQEKKEQEVEVEGGPTIFEEVSVNPTIKEAISHSTVHKRDKPHKNMGKKCKGKHIIIQQEPVGEHDEIIPGSVMRLLREGIQRQKAIYDVIYTFTKTQPGIEFPRSLFSNEHGGLLKERNVLCNISSLTSYQDHHSHVHQHEEHDCVVFQKRNGEYFFRYMA